MKSRLAIALGIGFPLFLAGCKEGSGRVHVAVTVDWEGAYLDPENLDVFQAVRGRIPDVPLTHFVCPAYFTKAHARSSTVAALLSRFIRRGDEVGLHIHAWRSLIQRAGVPFKSSPVFLASEDGSPTVYEDDDVGFEVDLDAYSRDELRAVFRTSKSILDSAGFLVSTSFRAGAWLGTPRVLEAARAEGFLVDASAVDAAWLDEQKGEVLVSRVKDIWPKVQPMTEPYSIATPAGAILEMPDSGAMADYASAREMEAHLREALKALDDHPSRDVFVEIGFHQETAADYAERVPAALAALPSEAKKRMVFETVDAASKAARRVVR